MCFIFSGSRMKFFRYVIWRRRSFQFKNQAQSRTVFRLALNSFFTNCSEKSNFCTNPFVSPKRRFWYMIWPHNTKLDFRSLVLSIISIKVLDLVSIFYLHKAKIFLFHLSLLVNGRECHAKLLALNNRFSSRVSSLSAIALSSTFGAGGAENFYKWPVFRPQNEFF